MFKTCLTGFGSKKKPVLQVLANNESTFTKFNSRCFKSRYCNKTSLFYMCEQ